MAKFTFSWGAASGKQQGLMHALLGVLVVMLTAAAYYVFLYADLSDRISKEQRQERSLRGELADMRQKQIAYQRDLAELAERQQHQRELNAVLPETTEHPAFLSAIQSVANVASVTLQGWTPQEESVQKFYAKIPMRLVLSGRYHQIAKFFHGVGQLDRIINIENITLAQPKLVGEDLTLQVECLATSFRSIPTRQTPGAAAGRP